MRCYSELVLLRTFEERFNYLRLDGKIGAETFGWDRYLNQRLYRSREWQNVRHHIIARDEASDLGILEYPILSRGQIHHIEPITPDDIINGHPKLFDPENLILVSPQTHKAIHYGTSGLPRDTLVTRRPNDQCPWLF